MSGHLPAVEGAAMLSVGNRANAGNKSKVCEASYGTESVGHA